MRVLIIGGGGMIGRKLARALAARGALRGEPVSRLILADVTEPAPVEAPFPVTSRRLDITDRAAVEAALAEARPDVIYHLAAVVSGQAEAEFDLGMAVNLDGSRHVLEAARGLGTRPVLVFTSSVAVFGGDVPGPIDDWTATNPQTSYGAQKAAVELLVTDYSRRGFIDGRAPRLPTITIRPGRPNRAASSFMSSIFREPLRGEEAVCPVGPDYALWALSPRRCVANLIHAAEIAGEALGPNRAFNMPGRRYTIGEMVEAMRRVAGEAPVGLIRWEADETIRRIVEGWRADLDASRAEALGFEADAGFEENLRFFLEEDLRAG